MRQGMREIPRRCTATAGKAESLVRRFCFSMYHAPYAREKAEDSSES